MNYIKKLNNTINETKSEVSEIEAELLEIAIYLSSDKFHGHENNYVHVSTDILPKVRNVLNKVRILRKEIEYQVRS